MPQCHAGGSCFIRSYTQWVISRHDVPGQRVKLTRVTDPSVSGLKIPLDEDALREKEVRDREKLKAMTEFAYSSGCRQQWILNYFGEEDGVPCGRCDQCLALGVEEGQSLGEEETLVVRQALSGIARASVRLADGSWQGRWGRTKIIQMLKGENPGVVKNIPGPAEYLWHPFPME